MNEPDEDDYADRDVSAALINLFQEAVAQARLLK